MNKQLLNFKQLSLHLRLCGEDAIDPIEEEIDLLFNEGIDYSTMAEEEIVEHLNELTFSPELGESEIKQILSIYEYNPELIKGNKVAEDIAAKAEAMLVAEGNKHFDDKKDDDKDDDEEESEDLFSGKEKKTFKEEDFSSIDLKNVETYIKAKYNIDVTKKGLKSFFESVDKMRANSQKVTSAEKELEALNNILSDLPTELASALDALRTGKDYKTAFLSSLGGDIFAYDANKLDDNKTFAIVKNYFPEIGTFEEFDTKDPITAKTIKTAIALFSKEKEILENRNNETKEKNKAKIIALQSSLDEAKKHISEEFPQFPKSEVDAIAAELGSINSFFYNKDGTVRKDAILNIALIKHSLKSLKEKDKIINTLKTSKKLDNDVAKGVKGGKKAPEKKPEVSSFLGSMKTKSVY